MSTVALLLVLEAARAAALAWAVADVWPASARRTAALIVWPGDAEAAESGAEAAVAETAFTDPACVRVRMEPLAVTVTRLCDAPNDRTAFVVRDAAVRLRIPVVMSESRELVPVSTWPTADRRESSTPVRTDERPELRAAPWSAADVELLVPDLSDWFVEPSSGWAFAIGVAAITPALAMANPAVR